MAVNLRSGIFSLILPNPEFGDTESNLDEITLGRSMIGGVYTYVKTKKEKRLIYNFIIHRNKYYELEAFYENTIAQPIELKNWKNETWLGFIINDVLDNTEKRVHDNQVTIEFEGIRTN